jgi:hypothetical protein
MRGMAVNHTSRHPQAGCELPKGIAVLTSGECCINYGNVASGKYVLDRCDQIRIHPSSKVLGIHPLAQRRSSVSTIINPRQTLALDV